MSKPTPTRQSSASVSPSVSSSSLAALQARRAQLAAGSATTASGEPVTMIDPTLGTAGRMAQSPSLPSSLDRHASNTARDNANAILGRRTSALPGSGSRDSNFTSSMTRFSSFGYRSTKSHKTMAVVLDIGDRYTKVGFANEPLPRVVFPTVFERANGQKITTPFSRMNTRFKLKTWIPILERFVRQIYFEQLQVAPKDRRVVICENLFMPYAFKKALVRALLGVEVPGIMFLPSIHLATICTGQQSAIVVDIGYAETRCAAVCEGYLVHDSITSVPLGSYDVLNRFADKLTGASTTAADAKSAAQPAKPLDPRLTTSVLESMLLRTAFVRGIPAAKGQKATEEKKAVEESDKLSRRSSIGSTGMLSPSSSTKSITGTPGAPVPKRPPGPPPGAGPAPAIAVSKDLPEPPAIQYPLPLWGTLAEVTGNAARIDVKASSITVSGDARHNSFDVLFGENDEGFSIADCILTCLSKCTIDVRSAVSGCLLLTGGAVNAPGFSKRVLDEVNTALNLKKWAAMKALYCKIKVYGHHTAAPPQLLQWMGGSVFASIDMEADRFINKENIDEFRFKDWTTHANVSLFTDAEAERVTAEDEDEEATY